MSEIILPEGVEDEQEPEKKEEAQYDAKEDDEERFFLMYHMNFQPSEVEKINPQYRKWLVMRFIAQKNLEQEAVQRQRLMAQLGPSLKG